MIFFHKYISKFRNFGNTVRTFFGNNYLRIKNWNKFFDPILKSGDESVYEFKEKYKKEETIEKMNGLIKLLKDEGMNSSLEKSLATSSTNSCEGNLILVISFIRTS